MLPLGNISINGTCHGLQNRYTQFTRDEQITLMTLWSIFRSPLMFGGKMRNNDECTLSLITNEEILDINQNSHSARPVFDDGKTIVWQSVSVRENPVIAVFNADKAEREIAVDLEDLSISGEHTLRDLWKKENVGRVNNKLTVTVNPHGAKIYELY